MKPRPKPEQIKDGAKRLRREMTFPERLLWSRLRRNALGGHQFKRQVPIEGYFVDFLCASKKFIVEVDGMSHLDRADEDRVRQARLEALGYRVFRVTNDEVIGGIDDVLEGILRAMGED